MWIVAVNGCISLKKKTNMERRFTGFFIPVELIENKELSWVDRIILSEIDALNINGDGCFASNEHFCKLLDVKMRTVVYSIGKLNKMELISIKNPQSKNRLLFVNDEVKQLRKKLRSNYAKNCAPTTQGIAQLHIYKDEITNERNPPTPQGAGERPFSVDRKSWTDPAVDVNSEKINFTVEEKKQRLNNLVNLFTINSDFIEFASRRLSLDANEVKKLLKKFLDTIGTDDTCYDSFSILRRRATAYIIKIREKAA